MKRDHEAKRSYAKKYQKPTILYLSDLVEGSGACTLGYSHGWDDCSVGGYVTSNCFQGGNVMPGSCTQG
ncbi:MAG: hypothetical protein ONA69_09560, partial [candidate division KSB1 bacterium]|nr:hypothetical protein [candidate division KSB1 bacterium]